MIGFAVVFGLLAVFIAQVWLNSQANVRAKNLDAQQDAGRRADHRRREASRCVSAPSSMPRCCAKCRGRPTRCRPAPSPRSPTLLSSGRRVVLAAIEANEPVLALKITGAGQRATLSALVGGMKAVTIRVNDVEGVGGFVLPGDRVDVVLTRQIDKGNATTDVVLQNARVLAVDQIADERADKPTVAKAVTLEVDTVGAQKIVACGLGRQPVAAAAQGRRATAETRRGKITLNDLGTTEAVSTRQGADGAPVVGDARVGEAGIHRAGRGNEWGFGRGGAEASRPGKSGPVIMRGGGACRE